MALANPVLLIAITANTLKESVSIVPLASQMFIASILLGTTVDANLDTVIHHQEQSITAAAKNVETAMRQAALAVSLTPTGRSMKTRSVFAWVT